MMVLWAMVQAKETKWWTSNLKKISLFNLWLPDLWLPDIHSQDIWDWNCLFLMNKPFKLVFKTFHLEVETLPVHYSSDFAALLLILISC